MIDLLIGFLKQPLSKAEDIIAGDIDDHIASQNFAISYAEDISTSDIGVHTAGQSFAVSRAEGLLAMLMATSKLWQSEVQLSQPQHSNTICAQSWKDSFSPSY